MAIESKRKKVESLPLRLKEVAAPATPPAGFSEVYVKADGLLYSKDDAGVEIQVGNVWPKLAPNGTIGAPSYAFANDAGSGWRLNAVRDMRASMNGSDRIVITDDGAGNGATNIASKGTSPVGLFIATTIKFGVYPNNVTAAVPINHVEQASAPSTPISGELATYAKTADNHLYAKNDAGVESMLSHYVICTSSTRPAGVDGLQIYETDTFKTYIYIAAKSGWFPPWNTAWGNLARVTLTGNTTAASATTTFTDMNLTNVPVRADRDYVLHIDTSVVISGSGPQWSLELLVAGTVAGRYEIFYAAQPWGERANASILYQPAATGAVTFGVQGAEIAGTATFQLAAAAAFPRQHWIEDVGPRT